MTVDLQSHAEAILRTVFIDLHDFDDADIQEVLTACAALFDAGAKAMQEAALHICDAEGDDAIWGQIFPIDPATLRMKGPDHE